MTEKTWYLPGEITISASGKVWPDGKSRGIDLGLKLATEPDQDYNEAFDEWGKWLQKKQEELLNGETTLEDFVKETGAVVSPAPVEMDADMNAEEKPPLPGEAEAAMPINPGEKPESGPAPEPRYVPADNEGNDYEEIAIDYFIVQIKKDGQKYARAFNKKYHQHGVNVYAEVMKESPIGDVQEHDVGQRLEPSGDPLIGLGVRKDDSKWASKIVGWK